MRIAVPKKIKNKAKLRLIQGSFLLGFLALFLLLVFPLTVHAEGVYSVLASTDPGSFGGQVQQIWKQLLNVVNSLVVLILILVAFAEMLRININTYGVKKILPTLILAIIAANFSFMFCRLIIDVANVSLTFVKCIGDPTGCGATLTTTTSGNPILAGDAKLLELTGFTWESIQKSLLGSLMQNIILFVEAVLLLCLAFLFIVRNWVLYALVIFSPIAFMAMVVPQTKKYFNQWWTMLIQWTFMPLVSFIFIALANKFAGVIPTAGLMSSVFVGVCLYAAITMPFKLGGNVMQSFYKMTGAKHLAGKTRELAVTRASAIGNQAWGQYRAIGLNAERGKNWLGKSALGRAIGRNWIGTNLDKAKGDLAESEKFIAGITEGTQARHFERQGSRLVKQRAYNRNREGEIKEYGLYMTEDLIRRGLEDEKAGRTNSRSAKDLEILRNWRNGSAVAKIRMSTAEEAENSLINKGTRLFMRDPADESLSVAEKTELLKSFGYSNEEYERFKGYYQFITSDRDSTEAEAKKAIGDPTRDAMEEIVGTHNVAEFKQYSQRIAGIVSRWGDRFKTFLRGNEDEIKTMVDNMTETDRTDWSKAETQAALRSAKKNLPFLRKIAIDQKALNRREVDKILDTDDIGNGIRARMVSFADSNYRSKIVQIQTMIQKNGGVVPLHLADLVSSDERGGLELKPLDGLRASRMRLLLDKRIQDGATEWMTQYGLSALGEALINGLPYESTDPGDILAVHYNRVQPNKSRKNARKGQQIELGVIKGMMLGNQTQSLEAADHFYNFLRHYQNNPDAIPEAIKADIISDQIREREEIHARLKDEFATPELLENLRSRGGESGKELATMVEKAALGDADHERLYELLQNTFKSASLQGTGGSSLGKMIIKSTFGERARVAEGSS